MIDAPKQLTDSQKIILEHIDKRLDQLEKKFEQKMEQADQRFGIMRNIWQAVWKGLGVIKAEVEIVLGWKK